MPIKRLIAIKYSCEEEHVTTFPAGWEYVYLVDPETGKYYEPKPGWEVTGENLEELFDEVKPE